jgi:hypothetical protein
MSSRRLVRIALALSAIASGTGTWARVEDDNRLVKIFLLSAGAVLALTGLGVAIASFIVGRRERRAGYKPAKPTWRQMFGRTTPLRVRLRGLAVALAGWVLLAIPSFIYDPGSLALELVLLIGGSLLYLSGIGASMLVWAREPEPR